MDRNGKPFIQSAHAVDVTRAGGRLRDLYCLDKKGDVIRVQHGNQKANFRITWIGHPGTAEDGQVGIYCIEPEKYIWGISLPKRSAPDNFEVVDDTAEMLTFNEHPMRSTFAGRTAGSTGTGAATAVAMSKGESRPGKKRVHPRFPCTGAVEVCPEGGSMPVWCVLSDISMSGCYAETTSPLPAHTRVEIVLKVANTNIRTRGVVRTTHPGVGMGLSFTHISEEESSRLAVFIEKLERDIESGKVVVPSDIIPSSFHAPKEPPLAEPRREDRSLLEVHNRAAAATAVVPAEEDLTRRLQRLSTELWELEQLVSARHFDARITREFKQASDYARQCAWAVQHWSEQKAKGKDPFDVMHKLNSERIRGAIETAHNLGIDIDAKEIDVELEGLDELYSSVRELYGRLLKLLKRE
jgi:hypothetical protein